MSATTPEGASRNTPTGSIPHVRARPARGTASLGIDMANAVPDEYEPGKGGGTSGIRSAG